MEGETVRRISQAMDIPDVCAEFLVSRSIITPESAHDYLFPDASQCHDPFGFLNMESAVEIMRTAIARKKKVLIHGDYDVDGICGTAILYQYLDGMGSEVLRFLPDRRQDGYGLSSRAADWAIQNGVGLLIAVDCGTSDGEIVSTLEDAGIDVIICDHHEFPKDRPVPGIVLNPMQENERYPFKDLAGTGVAFKLIQALSMRGIMGGVQPAALLDLVAIATVGDLAALIDENRFLVKSGLDVLNETPRPGILAIRESASLTIKAMKSGHLSFVVVPRLNAPGRLSLPKPALELLCTNDLREARALAERLERDNRLRRQLTDEVFEEARQQIEQMGDVSEMGGFVVSGEEWDEGVIGIVASRLVDSLGRPVVVISIQDSKGKGSARSVPGIHLKEALDRCASHLIKYGGHSQAAGLTIDVSAMEDFKRDLNRHLREPTRALPSRPILLIDGELTLDDCTDEFLEFLELCEPYGSGNREPVWNVKRLKVKSESQMINDTHLKLFFQDENGLDGDAIYFSAPAHVEPGSLKGTLVDLAVKVRRASFREREYAELRVVDMRRSGG